MRAQLWNALLAVVVLLLASPAWTQTPMPLPERVIRMAGALHPRSAEPAVETVRFAIYDQETDGTLLWEELQSVAVDQAGQYSVLLGATHSDGLPASLFADGSARWLSVHRPGDAAGPRTFLTAVPYAMTAATAGDAATLGGRPATDYALTPAARRKDAATTDGRVDAAGDAATREVGPLVNSGTANYIGKFANNVDLVNSSLYDVSGRIGIGTTTPLDFIHSQFTNTTGQFTGYAVQNLGNTATSYSGMLFYDHTGALGQFQGFNNVTKEYRINNIAPGGSINFMLGGTSTFAVNSNRTVAVNSPLSRPLTLTGATHSFLSVNASVFSGVAYTIGGTDRFLGYVDSLGSFNLLDSDDFSIPVRLKIDGTSGYVGIGTTAPAVPLDVTGGIPYSNSQTSAYFWSGASSLISFSGNYDNVTIRASNYIVGQGIGAISDARIKNVKGRSEGAADLVTLNRIEIADYLFKDAVEKGAVPQKKVVAQQVEQVFPQAVSRMTDVVPDIYRKAPLTGGWISLATDLNVGERVRLITEKGHRAVHEVLEVEAGRFRTDFVEPVDEVFVYGREVKDFRVVDYEAISMLNVSATQELARRLERQTAETDMLRQELAELRLTLAAALERAGAIRVRRDR